MGALEDCIDRTLSYALERHQFKRPIASFQLVQKKLVDAQTEAALGLLASYQVGRLKDQGKLAPEMISMVKRNNCGKALQHSRVVLDILGGNACADESVVSFCLSRCIVSALMSLTLIHSLLHILLTLGRGGALWTLTHSSSGLRRYHVGRHVANLQVTNTYEGTGLICVLNLYICHKY